MPQTRKRKTKEKVSDEVEKKIKKTLSITTKPSKRKGKCEEVSESSEKKSHKSVKKTSSKKKVVKSTLDSDAESSDESTKNKNTSEQNSVSPKKDSKLGKVKVAMSSINVKDEPVDSGNFLSSLNSSDSGIMSDTIVGVDAIKTEKATDESMKSELSGSCNEIVCIKEENGTDSSESEWEEVEDEVNLDDYKPNIPEEGVEITIDCPELQIRKRKKKTFDENEWIRLYINRNRKDIQLSVHKTHLLCLLAHGIYVNKILNSDTLKALAMSFISDDILSFTNGKKVDKVDLPGIEKILVWFRDTFSVETETYLLKNVFISLMENFECKKSSNTSEYNLMFIIIARMLGFKVRFCMSLYPVTHKASNLIKKPNSKKSSKKLKLDEETEKCNENEPECSKTQKKKRKNPEIPKSVKDKKVTSINKCEKKTDSKKVIRPRRSAEKSYKLSDEDDSSDDDFIMTHNKSSNEGTQKSQRSSSKPKDTSRKPRRSAGKSYKVSDEDDDSDDEDFIMTYDKSSDEDSQKPRKSCSKQKDTSRKKRSNRSVLSSDSEPPSPQTSACKPGTILCWAEVFSKPDKQWIPIECVNNIINKPYEVEGLLPQPVSYILAIDNESCVKDVTRRYCSEYLTVTRKLRVDPEWWDDTLETFLPPNSKQDKDEEKKLDEMLINKPLPKTIQEYKNHPLYALKRHLLKFEGIYPPDAASVGFMRGEPVYSRDCVCQLHSRETWVKEARVVKVGEEPYKIVKARPKWDRMASIMRTDLPLELFGLWQTEQYKPPVAVNGKVPRNEYGNVELFKPCMLPKGTVHLQLPGLNRVAKKLGIDCSPAVVGFDGHKGSVHPVFEGFVVCEEFKDTVIAAWEEEQENAKKREEEKREKRIYGNWKKLIKGLLIRERIKLKYDTK